MIFLAVYSLWNVIWETFIVVGVASGYVGKSCLFLSHIIMRNRENAFVH